MALITCPSCGHPISDKAVRCPQCGYTTSVRTNEENPANNPSTNNTAVQNPSIQAEATNNQTSKDMESPVNSSKKNIDKEWQQFESKWSLSARPNGKKSAENTHTQDSHRLSQQKGTLTNKTIATILIIMAAAIVLGNLYTNIQIVHIIQGTQRLAEQILESREIPSVTDETIQSLIPPPPSERYKNSQQKQNTQTGNPQTNNPSNQGEYRKQSGDTIVYGLPRSHSGTLY